MGGLNVHFIPFWSRLCSICCISHDFKASFSSFSVETKFVPLSDRYSDTGPLLAMKRLNTRVCIKRMCNFQMYCTSGKTCKNHAIALHDATGSFYFQWSKIIDPYMGEGWKVRGQQANLPFSVHVHFNLFFCMVCIHE